MDQVGVGDGVRIGRHQAVVEVARSVVLVRDGPQRFAWLHDVLEVVLVAGNDLGSQNRRHDDLVQFLPVFRRDPEHLDEDPVELKGGARHVDDQLELPVSPHAVAGHEEPGDLIVSLVDPVVVVGLERAAGHARDLDLVRDEVIRTRLLYIDGHDRSSPGRTLRRSSRSRRDLWVLHHMQDQRESFIVDCLVDAFSDLIEADPDAFRTKFRKMAADPFAFYRGSACVFYADVADRDDRWADERTSRVWIQGDLHAENFGTYMDGSGLLIFDVNDFDEAFVGHFTWDLQRFAASIALLCWQKALSDEEIGSLIEIFVRGYVKQVRWFVDVDDDSSFSLNLQTARGAVLSALQSARLSTRSQMLDRMTRVDDWDRRFRELPGVRRIEDDECDIVTDAFDRYLETIPETKRFRGIAYDIK